MKFFGVVGFAAEAVESKPGVWTEVVTEKQYFGDVRRNTRQLRDGEKVNDDLSVSNSISIVADPYLNERILAIRYVKWAGSYFQVDDVEVDTDGRPRLLLRLGGVYNGKKADPS